MRLSSQEPLFPPRGQRPNFSIAVRPSNARHIKYFYLPGRTTGSVIQIVDMHGKVVLTVETTGVTLSNSGFVRSNSPPFRLRAFIGNYTELLYQKEIPVDVAFPKGMKLPPGSRPLKGHPGTEAQIGGGGEAPPEGVSHE